MKHNCNYVMLERSLCKEKQSDTEINHLIVIEDNDINMTDDEKIDRAAARMLRLYRKAFEELAK